MRRSRLAVVAAITIAGSTACGNDIGAPEALTQLASVVPAGGAVNVDPATSIVVGFSHPMMDGMEGYMALHEGDVNGPGVQCAWSWSSDHARLTLQPAHALKPARTYTIHIGGGMLDAGGRMIGFDDHGERMGGHWATGTMVGGGVGMMGSGWQHANGSSGMVFTFTTR